MKFTKICLLAILALSIYTVNCALADDEITMPGWTNYKGKVYNGFIGPNSDIKGKIHYMFVQKQDDETPEDSPIVLYLAGGKGCSSLIGLVQEFGPRRMIYPRQVFTTTDNKYAWSKQANLLYFEAPIFTGFSQQDVKLEDYEAGDEQTAVELYASLTEFLKTNSSYKQSQIILVTEGLGGLYTTILANKIQEGNSGKKLGDDGFINLITIMYGNTELSNKNSPDLIERDHQLTYLDEHGLYGPDLEDIYYKCVQDDYTNPLCEYFDEKNEVIRTQMNPFNFYGLCQTKWANAPDEEEEEDISENAYCMDWSGMQTYFRNNKEVFNKNIEKPRYWQMCNPSLEQNYKFMSESAFFMLKGILDNNKDIQIMFYAGINDSSIPYQAPASEYKSMRKLLAQKEQENTKRFIDSEKQLAFWVDRTEQLSYIRVRGAGHFIGTDQPAAAYKLLQLAITGF